MYNQRRLILVGQLSLFSSFCIGFETELNDLALKVLKYSTLQKEFVRLLTGNLRFLIQNVLNELLCYTDIKESCLFMAEVKKTLELNNQGRSNGLGTVFPRLDRF